MEINHGRIMIMMRANQLLAASPLVLLSSALASGGAGAGSDGTGSIPLYDPSTAWHRCALGGGGWLICQDYEGITYVVCPRDASVTPESLEAEDAVLYWGLGLVAFPCMRCPSADEPVRGVDCASAVENLAGTSNLTEAAAASYLDLCEAYCEAGAEGDPCSEGSACTKASEYCDFADEAGGSGTCRPCPRDLSDCYADPGLSDLTELGRRQCLDCDPGVCPDYGHSSLVVDGGEVQHTFMGLAVREPQQAVSGPLVDCSHLVLSGAEACEGAEGAVCLVDEVTRGALYWELSGRAEASGWSILLVCHFALLPLATRSSHLC